MRRAVFVGAVLLAAVVACGRSPSAAAPPPPPAHGMPLPAVTGVLDADGEDDGVSVAAPGPKLQRLAHTARARFEAIRPPAGTHPVVCDLTPFRDSLVASFAVKPIDVDGARIYAYHPNAPEPWRLVFDWDRGSVPFQTHEVGGQGLTRVRAIDGKLYATDSDAPMFGGFGLSPAPFEDYVFVSDTRGVFPSLEPGQRPPSNTLIAPFAFHMFDVVRFRGSIVASGGTVATPGRDGTRFPGGIFVGSDTEPRLNVQWRPGEGRPVGVVRTTYMHRFRGRLYIGFQNNERKIDWDLAVLSGPPDADTTAPPMLVRVTPQGGWLTRRFASAGGRLYWIASGYPGDGRGSALFASYDGSTFQRVVLPTGAGAPQDLQVVGDVRYLLTDRGLYRAVASDRYARIADAPPRAFDRFVTFCSAPLSVLGDSLYAGSTRDGTLYRLVPQ